jgi:hypothetical protein
MVALQRPTRTRLSWHRLHLRSGENAHRRWLVALHWNGPDLFSIVQRGHIASAGERHECAQRGQPQIATTHRIVSVVLQLVQERKDQIGLSVGEPHLAVGAVHSLRLAKSRSGFSESR